jgi:hypothetical protein
MPEVLEPFCERLRGYLPRFSTFVQAGSVEEGVASPEVKYLYEVTRGRLSRFQSIRR